jgi:hypothetical protein
MRILDRDGNLGVLYSPPGIPAGIRQNPVDSGISAESNFSSGVC